MTEGGERCQRTRGKEQTLLPVHQVQKLLPRLGRRPHTAEHTRRDRRAVGLADAAHGDTQMGRLHHDGHAEGLEHLGHREGDLLRQPLLDLEPAREHFGDPSNLGQADDPAVRDVSDVHLPRERDEMMLAQAEDVDVLHDHELVVVFLEDGVVDDVPEVQFVPVRQEHQRLGIPGRCLE